jgi:hypothetical protein
MFGGYSQHGGFDRGAERGRELAHNHKDKAKPKRTVFDTAMVAHVWAQQNQPYGRNAKATVYFDGPTIYSYGSHYPMASFVRPDIVLMNSASSTPTTGGHMRAVRSALRGDVNVFYVPDVRATSTEAHERNLSYLVKTVIDLDATARNTRCGGHTRRYAIGRIPRAVEVANDYQRTFFPRRRKPAVTVPADLDALMRAASDADSRKDFLAALRAWQTGGRSNKSWRGRTPWNHLARDLIRYAARYNRGARRRGESVKFSFDARRVLKIWRAAKKAEKYRALIAAYAAREAITLWRDGVTLTYSNPGYHAIRNAPCMLRVKGTEIETSWGARFPAEHARKAWRVISAVYRAGKPWQTNGHRIPLGHFQVDRIDSDGTLHAGCHTLSRAEIERCAELLGLPSVAEIES